MAENNEIKNDLVIYDGDQFWYQNGVVHRDNDLPAIIDKYGNKQWYQNGEHHRDHDKPAIEYANGDKKWFQNGELHRDNDLPAVEGAYGKAWYKNGVLHRDNGLPAIISINYDDGNKKEEYWEHGKQITQEESLYRKEMRNLKQDLTNSLPESSVKAPLQKI